MLRFQAPVVLQLPAGQLLRWQQNEAVQLRVQAGRVWVTRARDLDDHFLDAGDSILLEPSARALIGAEGSARVVFERAVPS